MQLSTPDGKWRIAGLFQRITFKKILKINPIYQIEGNNYSFDLLSYDVIHDTYKVYQQILKYGELVIDLISFQYKYTEQEKLQEKRNIVR